MNLFIALHRIFQLSMFYVPEFKMVFENQCGILGFNVHSIHQDT